MTRSLFKTHTLLGAAAVASLAVGCEASPTPSASATQATLAPAAQPLEVTPLSAMAADATPPAARAPDPSSAQVVLSPSLAPAAAEPMCDADGRPLAGNVRKGGSRQKCAIAQGPKP